MVNQIIYINKVAYGVIVIFRNNASVNNVSCRFPCNRIAVDHCIGFSKEGWVMNYVIITFISSQMGLEKGGIRSFMKIVNTPISVVDVEVDVFTSRRKHIHFCFSISQKLISHQGSMRRNIQYFISSKTISKRP